MTFLKNCRRCPYSCISAQYESLCTPGTVILSKVDTCQSQEVCCELSIPTYTSDLAISTKIPMTVLCSHSCPFDWQCIDAKFYERCDPSMISLNAICPSRTQICCWIPKERPCPSTHTCLLPTARGLCESESEILETSCPHNRVCCIVKILSQAISSTMPPCKHENASGGDIRRISSTTPVPLCEACVSLYIYLVLLPFPLLPFTSLYYLLTRRGSLGSQ